MTNQMPLLLELCLRRLLPIALTSGSTRRLGASDIDLQAVDFEPIRDDFPRSLHCLIGFSDETSDQQVGTEDFAIGRLIDDSGFELL
ncbi:MAG: hypothetical protein JO108_18755 [Acidobacteriaceae bacterium]|nr:hypothetical protein [Acidobacteriaceae bacterium]